MPDRELPVSAQALQKIAKPVFDIVSVVVPFTITSIRTGYRAFQKLPQNAMLFTYGSVFCFFGGTFPTLFAALQAAEHGGRKKILQSLSDLSDEALTIINESKKDDDADENKDGRKDVKDMSPAEFMTRKTKLVLRKMNPEKVDQAISNLYTVWLSVAAVLSIKFARTISMALSIADFLKKPCDRFITPTISKAIPDEYDKWVPIVISWIIKSTAMSIAWYIQVRPRFWPMFVNDLLLGSPLHCCFSPSYQFMAIRQVYHVRFHFGTVRRIDDGSSSLWFLRAPPHEIYP